MAKVYFTKQAVEDLTNIWNYTYEHWSEKQADAYYALLIASCQELAKKPSLGKEYDIVSKGLFGFKAGEHIIFYRVISPKEIDVVRILHGMMDLRKTI